MSFERAALFYAGACDILSGDDPGVTPGERAIAYACLSVAESVIDIARMKAGRDEADTDGFADGAADLMAVASIRLMERIDKRKGGH